MGRGKAILLYFPKDTPVSISLFKHRLDNKYKSNTRPRNDVIETREPNSRLGL